MKKSGNNQILMSCNASVPLYMRLLYQRYPISQKPSHQLSWSHYVELLKLDDELERSFYEQQAEGGGELEMENGK